MAIDDLSLIGGHVCLDFVNTAGDHLSDQPGEWLLSYADLVRWAQRAGVISHDEAVRLMHLADSQPDAAELALSKALALRETIFRLFLCVVRQQSPQASDLTTFNQALAEAPARAGIIEDGLLYGWRLSGEGISLAVVGWRLVWLAADLLTSEQLAQVKLCEGEQCGWLFLDTSRNRARRWCSMADCGNRAKANRYYRRHNKPLSDDPPDISS